VPDNTGKLKVFICAGFGFGPLILAKGKNMEKIGKVTEISPGTMKVFIAGGRSILVANVAGELYATDAMCPRSGCYLPNGTLEKNILTCPVHGAKFDITTGIAVKDITAEDKEMAESQAENLISYRLQVNGEDIFIEI
jgi:3-phenylpropionate/trans-cinnamate dioxygenase ferredoxin subunit/naphthalene 1,2-dioxygenase system ferredoxin subunit